MKIKYAVMLPILLVFSACSAMSVEECQLADWGERGYKAGTRGVTSGSVDSELAPYVKACAKGGIVPDADAFEDGRQEGARVYCRAENGFKVGRKGYSYNNVCDADLEEAFLVEHRKGLELHKYEAPVKEVQKALDEAIKNRDSYQSQRSSLESKIYDSETTSEDRKQYRREYSDLGDQLRNVRDDINRLTYEKVQKEKELQRFKTYKGY